jgi:hypothetical protein
MVTVVMRLVRGLTVMILFLMASTPGRAFTDAELIDGFNRTVFGSEYQSLGWQSHLVKKFTGPVHVFIDDRSSKRRGGEIGDFIRSLPGLIENLDISLVAAPEAANYRIFVVDRAAYRDIVSLEVYGRPSTTFAPGKCLVRVVSAGWGIARSDAVIVADEGEFLFHRCMVEETLQGLGPVNDDRSLMLSVFNDISLQSLFTSFDRHILNMLYHPRIEAGMTKAEAQRVLPEVAAEVQARLR